MNFEDLLDIVNKCNEIRSEINKINLSDSEAYQVRGLYPKWVEFIGKSLSMNDKVLYHDRLYKVIAPIPIVKEDQYPSIHTARLYSQITEPHLPEGGGQV